MAGYEVEAVWPLMHLNLAALILGTVSWSGQTLSQSPNVPEDPTCALIAQSVSSSTSVYYPGNPLLGLLGLSESSAAYEKGIYHWALSSTQRAKCVVQPGTSADVATIVSVFCDLRLSQPSNGFQISMLCSPASNTGFDKDTLCSEIKTYFPGSPWTDSIMFSTPKVKGGGHASNPGFSSTTGVHIAMGRFSEVTYDEEHQTAIVGAGLIWDNVYAALASHRVSVLGGRVTGVGVAGFILGGGTFHHSVRGGLRISISLTM